MRIFEQRSTTAIDGGADLLSQIKSHVRNLLGPDQIPIRIAVTRTGDHDAEIEVGIWEDAPDQVRAKADIFAYRQRELEGCGAFNALLVIPTGVGAELGGHSGDGGALACLMASACDTLITHPNVVNASDLNELPDNGLYVEGSLIGRLLMGEIGLQLVRSNRLLVVVDDHDDQTITEHSINAVSAARAAMGINCTEVVRMSGLEMGASYSESGRAVGWIKGLEVALEELEGRSGQFDAVAMTSRIRVPTNYHHDYYLGDMVNPWGGVEAMLTHSVSLAANVPSAHSPMMESQDIMNLTLGVVDPRMAAEVVSVTYLHSVLRGLHRSPRVVEDSGLFTRQDVVSAEDVSVLIVPDGCIGIPTLAALRQGIPVIAVRDKGCLMKNDLTRLGFEPDRLFIVDNYLEAIGVMMALRAGIAADSVRRPIAATRVAPPLREEQAQEFGDVIRLRAR